MFFMLEIFIKFGFDSCLIRILQMLIYMFKAGKGDLVGHKMPKSIWRHMWVLPNNFFARIFQHEIITFSNIMRFSDSLWEDQKCG